MNGKHPMFCDGNDVPHHVLGGIKRNQKVRVWKEVKKKKDAVDTCVKNKK